MKLKFGVYLTAILVALLIAGCGDEKKSDSDSSGTTTEQTESTGATEDTSTETEEGKPPAVTGSLKEKPEIATPEGSPPEELVIKDVKKGSGAAAKDGDKLKMQYVGLNWSNGAEFDSSWTSGQPFELELGAGNVIQGWDEGIKGMRVGGRRLLIIPPDMGYGEAGQPPTIPASETLVFVVDLVSSK